MVDIRRGPSGPPINIPDYPNSNGRPSDVLYGTGQFNPLFEAGEFPEIYVSTTGDDSNSGTSADSPFRTLKKALHLAVVSSVESSIFLGSGEHDPKGLEDPRLLTSKQKIIGTEFEEISGDFLASAYNSTSRVITFSPSPLWVVNELVGYYVQLVDGPSGPLPPLESYALISANTADTITVVYPPSLSVPPQAGDVYRISRAAAFFSSPEAILGPPGNSETSVIIPATPLRTYRQLQNVRIEGVTGEQLNMAGTFWLEGVKFSGFLNVNIFGCAYAGTGNTVATPRTGRGVITITHGARNPELRMSGDTFIMYVVGGRFIGIAAKWCVWQGGALRDNSSSFPHGCLVALNAEVSTINQNPAGRCLIDAGATHSVTCEGGRLIISSPLTHLGTGLLINCEQNGNASINKNPEATGSNRGLNVELGGQIRISGIDGSTLGSASAGESVGLGRITRAAAPWAPGDSVCNAANIPRDLCNIYRTSN